MTTIRYIRWSSLEQGNADRSSEDRQRAITDAYAPIESAVIDSLLAVAIDDIHFVSDDGAAKAEAKVAKLRQQETREVEGARRIIHLVMDGDELAAGAYEASKERLAATRAELKEAEAELGRALGQVSPAAHIKRVQEVRERIESEDSETKFEARSLVKAALGELLDEMVFNEDGSVVVILKNALGGFVMNDGRINRVVDGFKLTHVVDGVRLPVATGPHAEAFSQEISQKIKGL